MLPAATRWQTRDYLAATFLALATAATVLHQNLHLAVLWDLSYTLDTAFRIALHQTPYRDFPLVHAPLTFLIQAFIIKLTGRVYWHHALYAALAGAAATLLTWRILQRLLQNHLTAFLLALPLTVLGNYCILPFPSYDCDTTLTILLALYALQRLTHTGDNPGAPSMPSLLGHGWAATNARALLTGAALTLPLFTKQNIGLPFLLTAIAAIILLTAINLHHQKPTKPFLLTLTGTLAMLALALLTIHLTAGLHNYLHWTITFARQRRLPGLADMLHIYTDPTLLWTLPATAAALTLLYAASKPTTKPGAPFMPSHLGHEWVRKLLAPAAYLLLTLPFLHTLLYATPSTDPDDRAAALITLWPLILILATLQALYHLHKPTLTHLTPFLILAAINGTLLSQQLWGSTYAIWPLFILLLATLLTALPKSSLALTATIAATLLLTGTLYTLSNERLSYAKITQDQAAGPPTTSTLPTLRGLTTPGPWLPAFDELVRYTEQNIPHQDPILLLPGEDPFYFATGRAPQFPILLFDPATDPYTPQTLLADALAHNVHWLILKRNLQINADPMPNRDPSIALLQTEFLPCAHLTNYDIYHR